MVTQTVMDWEKSIKVMWFSKKQTWISTFTSDDMIAYENEK